MPRRLLLSLFVATVSCGLSFYLFNFAWLIYAAASGPLNPANTAGMQLALRHFAAPVSFAVGVTVFWMAFGRGGGRQ